MAELKVNERHNVKHDHHKASLADYVGKGALSLKSQELTLFDDPSLASSVGSMRFTPHTKDEIGGISVSFDEEHTRLENLLTYQGLDFSITEPKHESVKLWVYINDIDLIMCDHDLVHQNPQKGHATFWIQFAKSPDDPNRYNLQHTFEGSGWHLMEISFNTHNLCYPDWLKFDISEIHSMRILGFAKPGLELKFASLDKFTYENNGYITPDCPKNGRWISTCDADSVDGTVLTEWYASSFDFENKTQGASSLSITGVRGHEDYRCVWGGLKIPLTTDDILHFDMFVSNIDLVNPRSSIVRLSQLDSGTGSANYNFCFADFDRITLSREPLKTGWNSIDIPIKNMKKGYDKNYYTSEPDIELHHMVSYLNGTSETDEFILKYDNIYVYKQ